MSPSSTRVNSSQTLNPERRKRHLLRNRLGPLIILIIILFNLGSFTISEANYRLTLGYHCTASFIYNYISSTLLNHFFLTMSKYFPTFCMCSICYFHYFPARYFFWSAYAKRSVTSRREKSIIFFFLAQQPNAGQSRLIPEVSRSHTMTQHSR